MITRSTILIACVCDGDDTREAVVIAIEKVLDLTTETYLVTSEYDGHDLSIEIDFDGDASIGAYNDVLLAFLPFMVDNVETSFRFMRKDRYEARDQNGDVLTSSENYAHCAVIFASWVRGKDRSNEGAGIYDNATGKMVLTLRFTEDE